MKKIKLIRGTISIIITLLMVLSVSACKKNPDSIIKNKDMDKLIDKAGNKEDTDVGIDELLKNYDTYKNMIKDDSLKVTLNIDAKVSIPQTDKMSVIRIKQKKITEEQMNKIRKELIGDTQLYDGTVLQTQTKYDIEQEIKSIRDRISEVKNSNESEKNKKVYIEENQSMINRLEEEYKTAPNEINVKDIKSDYKLKSVADEYKKNKNDNYYSWMYSMDKSIESFYGISDGENNKFISFSVLNSENYGNRLMFRKGNHGYEFTSSVMGVGDSTRWKSEDIPKDANKDQPKGYEINYVKTHEDTVKLSKEDAINKANDFLKKVGITDFKAYEAELYTEQSDIRYKCDLDGVVCRTYYIIKYMRNINGAFVTFNSEEKYADSGSGENFSKKVWSDESIEFRINDNGIVGFDINVPIEEKETVVSNSALKNFEEIKKTFEKMIVVKNADEDGTTEINIDKAVLGYARISEKDSFDTGLLVPVWDFYGKINNQDSEKFNYQYSSLMTINAIDGTVINRTLGY